MTFQVGMLYEGKLFSFLTKQINPQWPETIGQLVNSPYTFITLQNYLTISNEIECMLNDLILSSKELPNYSLN